MKLVDAFIYNNEAKLFDLRHSVLGHKTNYTYLAESFHTFSGNLKAELSNSNVPNDIPYLRTVWDTNPPSVSRWENEASLRNHISYDRIKDTTNLTDDDIVLISDVDEIPDPKTFPLMIDKVETYGFCTFYMLNFYYYFNAIQEGGSYLWPGTIAVKLGTLKDQTADNLRRSREARSFQQGIFGGWHLSFMGGKDTIVNKIESFSHSEYDNEEFKNPQHLEKILKVHGNKFVDIFNRGNTFTLLEIPEALAILPKQVSKQYNKFEDLFYKRDT